MSDAMGELHAQHIEQLDKAVDQFADAMKKKLREKHDRGFHGWTDSKLKYVFERRCVDHVMKALHDNDSTQLVDAANFAMFAWRMG